MSRFYTLFSALLFNFEYLNFDLLNFNLSHRKKNKPEVDLGPAAHSMVLFVTIQYQEVISHWQSSSNLDDEGKIVKLPLYAIIFSSRQKIGSMGDKENPEDSNISHIRTFFLFSVRGKIIYYFHCWKTVLLWSICILAFLQSVIWINSIILEILELIVRVSKAWKFFISKHEIFLATNFHLKVH